MNKTHIILTILFLTIFQINHAQKAKSDSNVFGHVLCPDCVEHISFATIGVKGTTIGTTTDETGHYQLINLPEGTHTITASHMGYKPEEITVNIQKGETMELNFRLSEDALGLEEVVITGDRNETNRKESSTIVNTLTHRLFKSTQSVNLSEGLNFTPGLRMENNCQNCGFSQVRMNGMEGPYSQVLINSRPIFSGLAGVYGLELIPANMIERVEVIRGGGSALYGSNAIAGTINVILKDPVNNSYEFGINSGLTGIFTGKEVQPAADHSLNFNTSLVSADNKTGMSLYGFYRDREPFDANSDGFSEISTIKNTTIGSRLYHRFGTRNKLSLDFFNINEERRGGDNFESPYHEANITEAVEHTITTGALTYEQFFRDTDLLSLFVSGQHINRDSYYGANKSLSDYGNTRDLSYSSGIQYNAVLNNGNLVVGIESNGSVLKDTKPGFRDLDNIVVVNDSVVTIPYKEGVTVANQSITTTGIFGQYDIKLNKFKASLGMRYDNYRVSDFQNMESEKTGDVLSPRLTLKYDVIPSLQVRASYSQGYRAPQIFDEDLHIETSGSRKVIHRNDPDLKQETSHSYMSSLDFNRQLGSIYLGILVEGFHTRLTDPFANEYSEPDENGTVEYTRINAEEGAIVQGVNLEMNLVPHESLSFTSGFTVQSSKYKAAQEFEEKKFFRTPADYGYFTLDWDPFKNAGISSTGNYTGKMLVPYFGNTLADEQGELRESDRFFDLGLKVRYETKLNGATLQVFTGMKNIFNSYQSDFDYGIDRDPGYIYGPMNPRTVYVGIKIGNSLKR
ncbi:MAG: TonB-dependent receptor [Bacteroidales bacterium]